MFVIWVALAAFGSAATAYLSVLAFVYFRQRSILYLPRRLNVSPAKVALATAAEIAIETADGEHLIGWYIAPREGRPVLLYFHGNAACLADVAPRLAKLSARGRGVLAIDYRGFGASSGQPTELGLHKDADAAYAAALSRGHTPKAIVLVGESLGSGVAVALAARVTVGGVLLLAPFTSALAIARFRFRLLPVRLLMRDRFRSDVAIRDVRAPLLILHGTADTSIPLRFGEALFALAHEPKSFVAVEGAGHLLLHLPQATAAMDAWLNGLYARVEPDQPPTRETPVRAI